MTNKDLNKEQLDAIHAEDGPVLIIAGAGTGKTTVITERIKHLILEKNVPPSQILALTYTEKASAEMENRVDIALPYGYSQLWISTFHAFCDRILRSEAFHIGLSSNFKLASEADSILFLRKHLFELELDYFRPLGNPDKFLGSMLQHFSRLKDEDISPQGYLNYADNLKSESIDNEEIKKTNELAHSFSKYEELKNKEGFMDFSDLIGNTLKLFRERKSILKIYQDQFKYILVDEFQDTNFSQNKLAIMLSNKYKNIMIVGDDDQAIYRWRGAAISNIIQFKDEFPKAKIITLARNYRSTQEILNSSYKLIQNNNPDRLEVKENIDKKLIAQRNIKGKEIDFIFAKNAEDEAERVANEIKKLKEKGSNYKNIAILVRANDHSQPFVRALERAKIPYQFLGPGQLFKQEEIKNLIAYLKILYNFEDSPSLYRVISMPIFDIDTRDIAGILNFAKKRNFSLFEAMEKIDEIIVSQKTKEKINFLTTMIRRHLKLIPKETGGQILYNFLKESGLLDTYVEYSSAKDEQVAQNIGKFFDKLKAFEAESPDPSVFAVVDFIDLAMELGESPLASSSDWAENDAVNILTVHSSKGLEFENVFLVNLVSSRFPTRDRKEAIPIPQVLIKEILPIGDFHIEEERRLFYVGMTRAKDKLFLTAAKFYGEGKRENKISPFVYEVLNESDVKKIIEENLLGKDKFQLSLLDWEEREIKEVSPKRNFKIEYLSYSQIHTFEICPLHYKLKYILKIPTPMSSSQSFGTSIHGALRDFYQRSLTEKNIDIKIANEFLEKNWINEGYKSREHEKRSYKKAENLIQTYLKKHFNKTALPIAIEYPFNFNLNGVKIGGRIDRIDPLGENKIEIIDYKTGKSPNEKELKDNLQLTVYALAASEVNDKILNKKTEEIILSLYYIEEDKKLTTVRTIEELNNAKREITDIINKIEVSDFKCSKKYCKDCEYKMICSTIST